MSPCGILATVLTRLLRRPGAPHAGRPIVEKTTGDDENRLADRMLTAALERAIALGLWAHADRVAASADRIRPRSHRLVEPIARLRLAQGDADEALREIDAARAGRSIPPSLRLLRVACLVRAGRLDEAHSDLLRWARRASAPIEARMMLALLEWEAGDEHAAMVALMRNVRSVDDPRSLEMLVLVATAVARPELAGSFADRLVAASAFGAGSPYLRSLLCSVGTPPPLEQRAPTADEIDRLASELVSKEDVIPTLVEAQRIRPRPEFGALLEPAIERAMPALATPAPAIEALARLTLIRGDRIAARRWVDEGLAQNPMSASLAILHRVLRTEAGPVQEGDERPDVLATIGAEPSSDDGAGPDAAPSSSPTIPREKAA